MCKRNDASYMLACKDVWLTAEQIDSRFIIIWRQHLDECSSNSNEMEEYISGHTEVKNATEVKR